MKHASPAQIEDGLRLVVLLVAAGGVVLWYRQNRSSSTTVGAYVNDPLRQARLQARQTLEDTQRLAEARKHLGPSPERLREWQASMKRHLSSGQLGAVRPRRA